MKNYLYILLTALLLSGVAELKAQNALVAMAQSGSFYTNPVLKQDGPDPSVIRADDGYFYMYTTGESIYRSKNLTSWTRVGSAFTGVTRPSFVSGVNSYWAPDINKIGDKYVLYYSCSVWGGIDKCGVGVAYADTPTGPFTIANGNGKLLISDEIGVRNSIDQFYIEDNGKKYLIWGSFYGIYAIELSDDGLTIKDGAEKVKICGNSFEGSLIYKRGSYYYYLGSTGSCCEGASSTYRTVYGRATSVLGPYYTKSGANLLNNNTYETLIHGNDVFAGTGHNAEIIEDDNGDTWILYHAYVKSNPDKGRQVLLDRILWTEDGWPYVPNSEPSNQSPKPYFK